MFSAATKSAHSAATAANYIEDVFSTYLYTGTGSSQSIENNIDLDTKGGLVWIKNRSSAANHMIFDTARGSGNYISSNLTNAQAQNANTLSTFASWGFEVGTNTVVNNSGSNFASWTFRKQAKFFDLVTYTGNGNNNRQISHSLNSVPGVIIIKRTDTTSDWPVLLKAATGDEIAYLNLTNASTPSGNATIFGNGSSYVSPTSTQFTVGSNISVNASGGTYVAYLFAHNAGGFGAAGTDNVISCGLYTGNGSTTGPVVNIGYEPQWLMIKRKDGVGNWHLFDNMRGIPTSGNDALLYANTDNAESTSSNFIDLNATGFQPRLGIAAINANGGEYAYIAIRRGPMKTPTTGTSVFSPVLSGDTTPTVLTTNFPVDMQIAKFQSDSGYDGYAADRLRGVVTTPTDAYSPLLAPNSTAAETNTVYGSRAWNNTGFQIPGNWSGSSTIYWNFRRAPGFFDVVCYTGQGGTINISHNLTVAPEMIIVKKRSAVDEWGVYHSALGNGKALLLNTTDTPYTAGYWQNTNPTSTQFTVGGTSLTNSSGATYVAYLFATLAGVSKVGSYTGTGSTQQINCGFSGGARFVLIKRTDSTGDWYVWDTARGIVSGNDPYLLMNSTAAEVTNTDYVDTYSAGFEISSTAPAGINANGGSYIYLAIA